MLILAKNASENFREFCTGTKDVKLVFKRNYLSISVTDPRETCIPFSI